MTVAGGNGGVDHPGTAGAAAICPRRLLEDAAAGRLPLAVGGSGPGGADPGANPENCCPVTGEEAANAPVAVEKGVERRRRSGGTRSNVDHA